MRFIEYIFYNVLFQICDSLILLTIVKRGSLEMELIFGNIVVDDIFFVPSYDINGLVVSKGNPILGVDVYLY